MDTPESLLVLSPDSQTYDAVNESSLGREFQLFYSAKGGDVEEFVRANGIHIILLEADDPPEDDFALLERLKRIDPLLNIIVLCPPGPSDEMLDWIHRGASDALARPLEIGLVRSSLGKVIDKRDLRRETFQLEKKLEKKYIFQGMVSKNPYMFEIFGVIENISRYFTSVLITGETGTGKEMVARAIHNLSGVKNRRLVICDCASIPETLFESELFGYVRGAFTGADRTKKGLFEDANDGTIFLDEIGEIPLPVQAKLLRVLENRQFRPLGSNEVKYVNVRVIAATNRNLAEQIKAGTFREDLYHRLNRVEIRIPPLRERTEDIPLLIRHVLENINRSFDKALKGVSRDVQKLFLKHDWPGNVRELENVLQSAALVSAKDFIDVGDLPKAMRAAVPLRSRMPTRGGEAFATLDELEKDYIQYVLTAVNFNLKKAAKTLDISRTTLYNKMAKYGLTRK